MLLFTSPRWLAGFECKFEPIKDTAYFALTGELWFVFCDDSAQNRPRYNGTALYVLVVLTHRWVLSLLQTRIWLHIPMATWFIPSLPVTTRERSLSTPQPGKSQCLQTSIMRRHKVIHWVYRFVKTHWGRDIMAAIFQTTFSNGFSWMKMFEFRLKFHWSLFLRVQLRISQHWFK